MTILVTGSAGFIGSAVVFKLLQAGYSVIGVDNHNDYYDPNLKDARVERYILHPNYTHLRLDITDASGLADAFFKYSPQKVISLAAQAGVRYSLENPRAYIQSNIVGFANILEECRQHSVKHLIYASSSSVYGGNTKTPFSTKDRADHPLSLYAASKRSNELMAHAYSHLYGLPTTGLRFFTVYGPWGRPDMALFKFTKAIIEGVPIQVFNGGHHKRDFTYIDDIVEGVVRVMDVVPSSLEATSGNHDSVIGVAPWKIYNIGSNREINLLDYIAALERALDKRAIKQMMPLQNGDVLDTFADVTDLVEAINYAPDTELSVGIQKFVNWYLQYYKNK